MKEKNLEPNWISYEKYSKQKEIPKKERGTKF